MARLLVIEPEEYFHTLFQEVLAQASYVAPEAVNSYEGSPAADVADLSEKSTQPANDNGDGGCPIAQL
jgi:hypothetical protein